MCRRTCFPHILRALHKRFKWGFVFAGFIALSLAAVSWNRESIETYWLWHRYFPISKSSSLSSNAFSSTLLFYSSSLPLIVVVLVFSAWHISIYTSAFFFLCSRRIASASPTDRPSLLVEDAAVSPAGH